MTIQVSAFKWVPDFAQGHVRDLRVRWALEEAGLPYEEVLVDGADLASTSYRGWQPFGQVPAYRDGTVEMFESGAIVLHIAEKSEALAPHDTAGRARMATWVLAALNTLEPPVMDLITLDIFHAGEAWIEERRPQAEQAVVKRLEQLAAWLGKRDYLEDRFTAGDLMMATVLRGLGDAKVLAAFPTLLAYRQRCVERPAFERALAAQLRAFREHAAA